MTRLPTTSLMPPLPHGRHCESPAGRVAVFQILRTQTPMVGRWPSGTSLRVGYRGGLRKIPSGHSPQFGQRLRLLKDCQRGLLLLVRRIAVLAEDALDEHSEICPYIFPHGPVYRDVSPNGLNQFLGDGPESRLAKHLHGTVVCL